MNAQEHAPLADHAQKQELFNLFSTGRFAQMAITAKLLTQKFPRDGQVWKALGVALMIQGQDAFDALSCAMNLLPDDVEVRSNIGGILANRGDLQAAAACYRFALQIQPAFASAHSNLGEVLVKQELWREAETHCRKALLLQPKLAAAHVNLGNALVGQVRLAEAFAAYQAAIEVSPLLPEAHLGLGMTYQAQGDLELATVSLRRALALRPAYALAHDQLGVVLQSNGQFDVALKCFRDAVKCQPSLASAQYHLGNVLMDLQQPDAAIASYRNCIALDKTRAHVFVNLGVALMAVHQFDDAVKTLRIAVSMEPTVALAQSNLGNALLSTRQMSEALLCHENALALAPELVIVRRNMAHLLKNMGQPAKALKLLEGASDIEPDHLTLRGEVLFVRQYLEHTDADRQRSHDLAQQFGTVATGQVIQHTNWTNLPLPNKCLRVGVISADLRTHPVGLFFESVVSAFCKHERERVEIWVYAGHRVDDEVSLRIRPMCHAWTNTLGLCDAQLSAVIRDDSIDILIDLSGHTRHNRLGVFARKPAPVQVSWLGFCATTGLKSIDAFVADPWIAPPGAERAFVEPVIRLPETFLCFTPPALDLPVMPLPALSGRGVRFACFNQPAKITDSVVELWSQIVLAVEQSQLCFQAGAFQDSGVRADFLLRFARHGVGPERLQFWPAQPRADYLASYGQTDIALDPFPYPGGTTSLEALWMGVPVLTQSGHSALARQGVSIMNNMNLPNWIARDTNEYLACAVSHANNLPELVTLREGLRQRLLGSPLCNAPRFAMYLESALRSVWQGWCKGR